MWDKLKEDLASLVRGTPESSEPKTLAEQLERLRESSLASSAPSVPPPASQPSNPIHNKVPDEIEGLELEYVFIDETQEGTQEQTDRTVRVSEEFYEFINHKLRKHETANTPREMNFEGKRYHTWGGTMIWVSTDSGDKALKSTKEFLWNNEDWLAGQYIIGRLAREENSKYSARQAMIEANKEAYEARQAEQERIRLFSLQEQEKIKQLLDQHDDLTGEIDLKF